jgi:outer membrane protein TolC
MEIPSINASMVRSLESITQLDISVDDTFLLPEFSDETSKTILRPELESFAFQKSLLDSRSNLVSRNRMPKISGFVTTGYGKPGLNMLSNEWDTYVIVGARLSWNIWDWNVAKREREQISIQKSIIDSRTKAFEDGLGSAVTSVENQINVLEEQLALDNQVIELLEQVKKKSESQLTNGLISSTEYLTDFNAAARAKLDREQRKVQLVKEKTRLRYLLGTEF